VARDIPPLSAAFGTPADGSSLRRAQLRAQRDVACSQAFDGEPPDTLPRTLAAFGAPKPRA
jgi:hypothetical protein